MNRITDIIVATQLSTVVAFACMYLAHLIEAGHILNPNWNFAVWVLLAVAIFFMLLPHLICHNNDRPDYAAIEAEHFGNTDSLHVSDCACQECKIYTKQHFLDDVDSDLPGIKIHADICLCAACRATSNAHVY